MKHYKKWQGVKAPLIPIAKRDGVVAQHMDKDGYGWVEIEVPPSLQFYPSYLTRTYP